MFLGCLKLKGAIAYDPQKLDVKYANPNNGYFYTSVDYDLYINGVRVDSHNCDDLTQIEGVTLTKSTGKAVYYPNVRRLYLTDVNIKTNSTGQLKGTYTVSFNQNNGKQREKCPTQY